MYQILIAPNAFKGSLDAVDVCKILKEELQSEHCQVHSFPLGDGGDGTASLLAYYLQAQTIITQSVDALGRSHWVEYYRQDDTAIIELATICGLKLLASEEYDVLNTNTAGLGKVIEEAVNSGCRKILLCVGGSASIDGGMGALLEMGLNIVKGTDQYRNHIIEVQNIEIDNLKRKYKDISFTILCDVDNPLTGILGAAKIFGPQKGASDLQVSLLEHQLSNFADIVFSKTEKDMKIVKHGGAAGGIVAAFHTLLDADLISGATYCIDLSGLEKQMDMADLLITGEGKIDTQSLYGKIPGAIAHLCKQHLLPVIAVAGMAEDNIEVFDRIYTLSEYAGSPKASLLNPKTYLRMVARDIKKQYLV